MSTARLLLCRIRMFWCLLDQRPEWESRPACSLNAALMRPWGITDIDISMDDLHSDSRLFSKVQSGSHCLNQHLVNDWDRRPICNIILLHIEFLTILFSFIVFVKLVRLSLVFLLKATWLDLTTYGMQHDHDAAHVGATRCTISACVDGAYQRQTTTLSMKLARARLCSWRGKGREGKGKEGRDKGGQEGGEG